MHIRYSESSAIGHGTMGAIPSRVMRLVDRYYGMGHVCCELMHMDIETLQPLQKYILH